MSEELSAADREELELYRRFALLVQMAVQAGVPRREAEAHFYVTVYEEEERNETRQLAAGRTDP